METRQRETIEENFENLREIMSGGRDNPNEGRDPRLNIVEACDAFMHCYPYSITEEMLAEIDACAAVRWYASRD
jgi:hypothetical protein